MMQESFILRNTIFYHPGLWVVVCLLMGVNIVSGQQKQLVPEADTTQTTKIILDEPCEYIEVEQRNDSLIQKLVGHVRLRQDSVFMACDSAILVNEAHLYATGNVVIQRLDSTYAFGNQLFYDGDSTLAELREEVILQRGSQKLAAPELYFHLDKNLAWYDSTAVMTNDTTQLSSIYGVYDLNREYITFWDSVIVIGEEFKMRTDTLGFSVDGNRVDFLGPTIIKTDSLEVYCEAGYYDISRGKALFAKNARFIGNKKSGEADTIIYLEQARTYKLSGQAWALMDGNRAKGKSITYNQKDDVLELEGNADFDGPDGKARGERLVYYVKEERFESTGQSTISQGDYIIGAEKTSFNQSTGWGLAEGNAVWQDTTNDFAVHASKLSYNKESGNFLALGKTKRPYISSIMDQDTFYLAADTLQSDQQIVETDTIRRFFAHRKVRLLREGMSARADSLMFTSKDSSFTLFDQPIIWQDSAQMTADTIVLYIKDGKIDRIDLRHNAFVINTVDFEYFNQIKGRYLTVTMKEGKIDNVRVNGSSDSVYYVLDENNAYIGVNELRCSTMEMQFQSNQVKRVLFFKKPEGKFYGMRDVDHAGLKREGYAWYYDDRFLYLEDLTEVK